VYKPVNTFSMLPKAKQRQSKDFTKLNCYRVRP